MTGMPETQIDYKNPPEWYCSSSDLSLDDQKWIWENIPHTDKEEQRNEIITVTGSVNDACKNDVDRWLNPSRKKVISHLKETRIATPEKEITSLLERLFESWPSYEGHWLWVAQTYTPRVINWVIGATVKQYLRGGIKKTPAHYFTYRIKHRTKRRGLTNTNGAYKKKRRGRR